MAYVMSIAERHKYILSILKRDGFIRVADIARDLDVTTVTVRKDFKQLEDMGLLYRTHGSACPANPHVADRNVSEKEKLNRRQKQAIGRAAVALIDADDSIMIASGSTIYAFAENIGSVNGALNVVTSSLKVSLILNGLENVNVIQLGGVIHKKSLSVRGLPLSEFDRFTCSKLFIGVDGLDTEYGVTTSNIEEAELTKQMMRICSKTIVLADSSKFSRRGFGKICNLDQIHTLVTDSGCPESVIKAMEEQGIRVVIAK